MNSTREFTIRRSLNGHDYELWIEYVPKKYYRQNPSSYQPIDNDDPEYQVQGFWEVIDDDGDDKLVAMSVSAEMVFGYAAVSLMAREDNDGS